MVLATAWQKLAQEPAARLDDRAQPSVTGTEARWAVTTGSAMESLMELLLVRQRLAQELVAHWDDRAQPSATGSVAGRVVTTGSATESLMELWLV